METPSRTSAGQWIAAAACVAWILAILPALHHPYMPEVPRLFGSAPDWRELLLRRAAAMGSAAGGLLWAAWAQATGVLEAAHGDRHFVPLTARAWLTEGLVSGRVVGILVAAALPPLLVSLVAAIAAWPRRRAMPALAVAAVWSAGLATGLAPLLGAQPTWLLLPPYRPGAAPPPPSEWCAHSLHARALECETIVMEWAGRGASGIGGFVYAGGRCIPAGEVPVPLPEKAAVARAVRVLERTIDPRAIVRRDVELGGESVDVVVSDDSGVLLAFDVVVEPDGRDDGVARRARLAAAGVRDYWRLLLHPNRDPITADSLQWWRTESGGRKLALAGESMHSDDVTLRLSTLAGFRLPIAQLLPIACTEPELPPVGVADAQLAFIVDGSAARPELTFRDVDADGVAHGARLVATSTRPAAFDPPANGVTIDVRPLYGGGIVFETVLPAGEAWRRDGDGWTYHDAAGTGAGVTDAAVRELDGDRLAWRVDAARARYRVPPSEVSRWGSIGVRVGSPVEVRAGRAATVFFPVGGDMGCAWSDPGTLACRSPEVPDVCAAGAAATPDDVTRCLLGRLANAQHAFFATHGRYFGGPCTELLDAPMPDGLVCTLIGTASEFRATALHVLGTHRQGCTWRSRPPDGGAPLGCS